MWRCRNREPGGAAYRDEAGFTLIELMVVILIIAILMAIAIPTYLGARNRAENRAAQTDLRNALSAVETAYSTNNSLTLPSTYSSWHAYFRSEDPAIDFIGSGNVDAAGPVSSYIWNGSGPQSQIVKLADWSSSGTCWVILDIFDSGYSYPWGGPNGGAVTVPGVYYGAFRSPANGCGQGFPAPAGGWQRSFSAATP